MSLKEKLDDRQALINTARYEQLRPVLKRYYFNNDKQTIVLMGDMHIGSRYFDEELLKEHLEWCLDTKTPIILMGDQIEAATRDSVGAGVYEQNEIIDEQVQHFIKLFAPLANEKLILGMHTGNHEARVYKRTGYDLGKAMAKELGVPALAWGQLHYIRVGGEGYLLYTTHGASGARLPHTKIKGVIDLANLVDAEIYAMGHLHQLSHHIRNYYAADLKHKKVVEKQKHFILTGSYLSHWGSYAHIQNLEPMRKGSAKLKLNGLEHRIRVSL